jgi:hypothetical protein
MFAALCLATCLSAMASPPEYFMGKFTNKLPKMKKAAALVLRNASCKSIATGLYIPPKEQLHPGEAYLITCNAPSRPGGMMDVYVSEADLARNRTVKPAMPVSIAKAWQLCKNALMRRYADSKTEIERVHVSDNHTANRRVDAVVSDAKRTAHTYCIVEPSGHTETHLLTQDARIRSGR